MVSLWDSSEAQWVRNGSELFAKALQSVSDTGLAEDCRLDGWTRAHVTAHVAANAQAIGRLLHWAATGEPTPMYESMEARDQEIAEGASKSAEEIREWWNRSDNELNRGFSMLSPQAWDQIVVTAQGREVSASETLWMRSRELCIHAVDLDASVGFADLPEEFLLRLIDEAAAKHSSSDVNPAVLLTDNAGREWRIEGAGEQFVVTGSLDALASWLTGRGADGVRDSRDSRPPDLAKWL